MDWGSETSAKAKQIAEAWLSSFADAAEKADVNTLVDLILPNGWFRDLLIFTWDLRSRHGTDDIQAYLSSTLAEKKPFNFAVDDQPYLQPSFFPISEGKSGLEFAFRFETSAALGRGGARLAPTDENQSSWKALSVMMMVDSWKGHEELPFESGIYDGHNLSWDEVQKQRREEVENDPQVVIIGAGQAGLQQAARNRQLGLRTLVIEQDARLGDVWRKRYPTLALHTPRSHHNLLYQPFPRNWPIFTPKDRLAFWFEQYAEANDLVVWTSSTLEPMPTYDKDSKRWNLVVNRNGTLVNLHPPHLVFATGFLGDARIPSVPGIEKFKGVTFHAGQYQGGAPYKDKRIIVVGACNTSADVCQDLVYRGAASVTMVQRSSTCVVSDKVVAFRFSFAYPDDVPVEISDFKAAAMPFGLLREMMKGMQPLAEEMDKEMHDGLRKAGFKLNAGTDGSGQLPLVYERAGGFFVDVGVVPLILDGKVKIKNGVEVEKFTSNGVIFTDGSAQEADVVVFATGWLNAKDKLRRVLGDQIVDQTKEIWGLDDEQELNGIYKYSGYPGLWFAAGDFAHSRYCSKQLGLFLQAHEIGLKSF